MGAKEKIDEIVQENTVVLFMKGSRVAPQCGFSATVIDILDDFLDDYVTFDVLADQRIRDGIKAYSDWPTIPQLFVNGKFVGGSDILREMRANGELEGILGEPQEATVPTVTLAPAAIKALNKYWDGEGKPVLRLEIDRQYHNSLFFDEAHDGDLTIEHERYRLVMARSTARRAEGVSVDWLSGGKVSGFKITNPSAPPRVKQLRSQDLKIWLDEGKPLEMFDVRTQAERVKARIEPSTLLDEEGKERLQQLNKEDVILVLYCHHGTRSQAAAEHCLKAGFTNVYNLIGGIDAWSREIDKTILRY